MVTTGQRERYDHFLNMGHSFAWDQKWDKAVAAYAKALQEVPEDPESHKYLGLALLQTKRYADALKVYMRAHQLAPDDPVPLEKSADVLERLGRLKEAAQQYISVAEIYLSQHDIEKSIGNFERATLLTPGLLQIHFRLAQLYERTGRKRAAVLQYLTLAFNFQRQKDKKRAIQSIERALRLEPNNPQVLNAKQAIEVDELMAVPKLDEAPTKARTVEDFAEPAPEPNEPKEKAAPNANGPLGEATDRALAILAEELLSGGLSMAEAQAIQGVELQKIGEAEAAIQAFQTAESLGIKSKAMSMCLGALFLTVQDWPNARKYFERVRNEPNYAGGAAHGLGRVYMGLSQPRQASELLVDALRKVDLELALHADETTQLTAVYDKLLASIQTMLEGDLAHTNTELDRWLTGTEWKARIPETRRTLNDYITSGRENELTDIVRDPSIIDALTRIDRYIKQGLLTLAMDESHFTIEKQPFSLPVHQRIAQVLLMEGQTQPAINKYNVVVNSFLARDDRLNAALILDEVIKVAPMDTGLRIALIELLEREGQSERVLEEYVGLADAYYQLAETDQARDTFQEALRLAQRINAPAQKRSEILYRLADIYMARLDLRQAQRTYEQIRNLMPEDERPRRELIEINYRLNNPLEAVKELDNLLRLYAQTKRGGQIVTLLESMVGQRSTDMALRSRLAAVYRQLNRRKEAIAQLDALGELQLEAGLYQDACVTIRQIITLQPADIKQYQTLLAQLGC